MLNAKQGELDNLPISKISSIVIPSSWSSFVTWTNGDCLGIREGDDRVRIGGSSGDSG